MCSMEGNVLLGLDRKIGLEVEHIDVVLVDHKREDSDPEEDLLLETGRNGVSISY